MIELHPAIIMMVGALLIPMLREGLGKNLYMVALPLVSLFNMLHLPHESLFTLSFLGFDIQPARVDNLALVFATIFHIAAALGMCFSFASRSNVERTFSLLYAGAAVGVVFAGDFLSFFLFWEALTVAAAVIIWDRRSKAAQGAGYRYILVHAFGGLLLLAGVVLHIVDTGSIAFEYVGLGTTASYLIFLGFGVNAAWPLLHAWVPDAYPEGSWAGTVFLSAFTTKSAVYALARAFPGAEPLIWIGAAMAIFPMFYGMIENDLRRVLSYSIINKVGFMMVGVGVGSQVAINGACAYAFAHILYKSLLFMALGAVLYRTGKTKVTELGGLYRTMPWTCIFCMVGAAALAAFPLTVGFPTKGMIMDGAAEAHEMIIWLALLFSSAGAMVYAGVKVPYYAFFAKDSGLRPAEAPASQLTAMAAAALLCVGLGVYPEPLYNLLPYEVEYHAYTGAHVLKQMQILLFAGAAFLLLALSGWLPAERKAMNLDVDWFYRRGFAAIFRGLDTVMNGVNAWCDRYIVNKATDAVMRAFDNAPFDLARFCVAPALAVLPTDERKQRLETLRRTFDTSSTPVGVTAFIAAVLATGLILYMLGVA